MFTDNENLKNLVLTEKERYLKRIKEELNLIAERYRTKFIENYGKPNKIHIKNVYK